MKQLIKNNKTGKLSVKEVPVPHLEETSLLVRNLYSAVSIGTESSSVEIAEKNLVQKARSRPEEFKKVLGLIKREGVFSAYKKVMNKLELPAPLGYSSAGEVIEVGDRVEGFQVGDMVACGGCGHAEIISVPRNLCVKVPEGVDLRNAAFTTLGAIALQGVRQADVRLGENVVVVGLGIVGQITMQLIEAAGGNAIGVDINSGIVDFSRNLGLIAFRREDDTLVEKIDALTEGAGPDSAIITAGTSSNDPIEFTSSILRDRGHLTMVGAVRMDIPRNPFYMKELSFNLSRSYGPGRYDINYEEKGQDYPIGYVRWTENRNMSAILDLMKKSSLNITDLITDQFDFMEAPAVYKNIKEKESPVIGTLLKYGKEVETAETIYLDSERKKIEKPTVDIGFIGAGSYAQGYLLPNLRSIKDINFKGLATATGMSADHVGRKYGFDYITTNAEEIINDDADCVFIATRHDLHAEYVTAALRQDKHVFVEKPLAINKDELGGIKEAWEGSKGSLMVGFNRRFSPLIKKAKEFFDDLAEPVSINYRVNAGELPPEHWLHDPETGGGRIVGEACHFVDLCNFIAGSEIKNVEFEMAGNPRINIPDEDNSIILLKYRNGSVAVISYFSNGDTSLPKERIEIFGGSSCMVIDDYKRGKLYANGRGRSLKLRKQDKGQGRMIMEYLDKIKSGDHLISAKDLFSVTEAMLNIRDSKKEQEKVTGEK